MRFNRNIWENDSNLKGKYNQFFVKCFHFFVFGISCLDTYHIVIMWSQEGNVFSTVYNASVGSDILHIFSSSNSTFSTFLISL